MDFLRDEESLAQRRLAPLLLPGIAPARCRRLVNRVRLGARPPACRRMCFLSCWLLIC